MKNLKIISIVVVIVVLLLGTFLIVNARGRSNTKVLPPTSRVEGLTYSEWLAKWWQYALEVPAPDNPLTNESNQCIIKRTGNVGLVVANSTLTVPIECEVPNGLMLYLEVLGAECSDLETDPFYGGTAEEQLVCAQAFVPQDLKATIDGVDVQDLDKYVFLSPQFEFNNPEENILEVPAGTIGKSVGSGAYLMLAPLSRGKHTVRVTGTYADLEYTADKTFNFTVTR